MDNMQIINGQITLVIGPEQADLLAKACSTAAITAETAGDNQASVILPVYANMFRAMALAAQGQFDAPPQLS